MKKFLILLSAVMLLPACSPLEPVSMKDFPLPDYPDASKKASVPGKSATETKPAASPGKTAAPEKSGRKTQQEKKAASSADKPDDEDEEESGRIRKVLIVPMNTENIRGMPEIYRDLNRREYVPDYKQTRPRERDPFYDTVNRTGSNPMNTPDRTTNRRN